MFKATRLGSMLLALGLSVGLASPASADPVGTSFTYQGYLTSGGTAVSEPVSVTFRLFDAPIDGTQRGNPIVAVVTPENGRFNRELDFGAQAIAGNTALWLEIEVEGETLPRQPLTATPFSLNTRGFAVTDIGRIGIGTDTPDRPLHIRSTDGNGTLLLERGGGNSSIAFRAFPDANFLIPDSDWNVRADNGSHSLGGPFIVDNEKIDGPPTIQIDADGRVGMKVQAPLAPFHMRSGGSPEGSMLLETFGSAEISLKSYPNTQFSTPNSAWKLSANEFNSVGFFEISEPDYDGRMFMIRGPEGSLGLGMPGGTIPKARIEINRLTAAGDDVMSFVGSGTLAFKLRSDLNRGDNNDIMWLEGRDQNPVISWNRNGRVGINGILGPAATLEVNGEICASAYLCASSRDLKSDITPIESALHLVDRLEGVKYTWNDSAAADLRGKPAIGFVAEDVAEVVPSIVWTDDHGKVAGLDYSKMTPIAIQAIKELKAEHDGAVAELRAENDELRARLDRLEKLLEASAALED